MGETRSEQQPSGAGVQFIAPILHTARTLRPKPIAPRLGKDTTLEVTRVHHYVLLSASKKRFDPLLAR